ncbi:MAG: DNA polymerase epsilon catalytic subunit [Sarcosagium campestre]|nr:MAG: DNA polymerase epsilon catalytic subunit [Sarcosagium campestre]
MPSRRPGNGPRRVFRGGHSSSAPSRSTKFAYDPSRPAESTSQDGKIEATRLAHSIDEKMGFARFDSGRPRVGWLCNMHSTTLEDDGVPGGRAAVDFYFLQDGGESFKATIEYEPYFLVAVKRRQEAEVEEWIRRKFEGLVKNVKRVDKEDLQMPNHLLGYRRIFLMLQFMNVADLLAVRKTIMPIAEKNKKSQDAMETYAEVASANAGFDVFDDSRDEDSRKIAVADPSDYIVDIREFDVPYHVRVAIDKDIRIGKWYTVGAKHGVTTFKCIEERLQRADPVVLAFDIETTKLPLKFPDAAFDQIMMISYMIDGEGVLITNREIVSEDIADFEYTPKPDFHGPFIVHNEKDERAVLERFFGHIKTAKPTVIATYNGDFFDWPFVEARASVVGIDMYQEIGFRKNSEDIYYSDYCVHMDCFSWVKRDSYLPQGSQGLKAVTVAKLGYDPDELDPELMTRYASERPQTLAEYSVSDAVATYYLYMKYVHPFVFSLCTIIPLNADDVLRKGTGTLCEMLLMVQAYQKEIILPNKHKDPKEAFWEGHLLESETYVGGHVESIEAGIFRSDIPVDFTLDATAIDELVGDLDAALQFSIAVENKTSLDSVSNYDEVKEEIRAQLLSLKSAPIRNETPSIYHLDVASMYPNIMTTNRLQPDSMITESDCAACDFNRPGKTCDRRMPWSWRGEFLPAKRDEYRMIRHTLQKERYPPRFPNGPPRSFGDLGPDEQANLVKKRLQEYSKKIYHKIHETKTLEREAIICQRENPFYVDTVKNFRDRRYDFKGQQKVWKNKTEALKAAGASATEVEEAKKMIILFDSLQLAHKVILNSFYGYVMRKGSRWYSMEMAGVTCLTGAHIIQMARQLVERIGRPLELDTDGIWCMLPGSFPENFSFKLKGDKKLHISYPCVMLNHLVHRRFTNHQYQDLKDPSTFRYETHSDNSIFFEVDGPYKAMVLPTSKEEDKNLKKRYAVFNHDGSLAELKGFEVKRRGELKLIKIFQSQIFNFFLQGSTLNETYAAVAGVANRWLDVLHQRGSTLADEELIDLICENRSMSKALEEYGAQKSTSITTAKRLAEFLGDQMVKDKGLNCKYIISSRPKNAPVTERAIPVAIFSAEEQVKRYFLRKWLRDEPGDMDPRSVLDWDYYLERLGSVIQKLITIPAALQKVDNPVSRVPHPDWLQRRINTKEDRFKQKKMTDHFDKQTLADITNVLDPRMPDLEDFGSTPLGKRRNGMVTKMVQKRKAPELVVQANTDPFASLPRTMPSISDDYQGWLRYQKQKWRIQRHARIRRRQLFGERSHKASDAIGNFFRNQAELLFNTTWQVLQFRAADSPGDVAAFVLIDKKIHSIKVKVPRIIFLNLKRKGLPDVDIDGCNVEKVTHTLPNGHASVHLFKLTMPEEVYVRHSKKLALLFNHSSVEGVYEQHVPLHTRAMLELGNHCTFDDSQRGVLGRGLEQGFDLAALRQAPSKEPYLTTPALGFVFLDHMISSERQVFSLFSTTRDSALVVVLNKGRDVKGFSSLDRVYTEEAQKRLDAAAGRQRQDGIQYQSSIAFKTLNVTTKRKAYLEIGKALKSMRSDQGKPLVLIVQSPQRRILTHDVAETREFPMLFKKYDADESHLPALGWQGVAARRLVKHYLDLGTWLPHLVELAQFGDVPLCNLDRDASSFVADVGYARRLQKNNVVLWWSAGARPDHAGYEKDDILGAMDVVELPSVNRSGAFSSVCIDIEVRNLAINTLLASSLINELEGSDSVSFNPAAAIDDDAGDSENRLSADNTFATAAIVVLRGMVKEWWNEGCRGNNTADVLVQHLVRWISSPSSFLYDRALHYYVQMMSRKVFQQIMTDFRRVGSQIIYASANRLLLQTSKTEVGNAYAFSQYVLKAIKTKPLFNFVELEIKEYWDFLVWYDAYNYGGKACGLVVEAENQRLNTVTHWQLASFLPELFQPTFKEWMLEFIEQMHAAKQPRARRELPSSTAGDARLTQIPYKTFDGDGADDDEMDDDRNPLLSDKFATPLKAEISKLLRRQKVEILSPTFADDYVFPTLPGSHLDLKDPVLQLVKSLTQMFSLAPELSLSARRLRSELLSEFEVREFSAAAHFENPSASLRIEQVQCPHCTSTRDLDLCRDEDASPNMSEWHCVPCGGGLSRVFIEEILVARLQKLVVEWSTMDQKCGKCKKVRIDDFAHHCSCSGKWAATVERSEVEKLVKIYARVATALNLKILGAVVEEVKSGL